MALTELWLVRHGESVANLAASSAEAAGLEVMTVEHRDADVPLSQAGERQAAALGRWLASLPAGERPTVGWCSPYRRAVQTAEAATAGLGADGGRLEVFSDERLRDRELGILDLLTSHGVEARHPEEAQRRRWLGKFYYRPPGGESWADVALRVRSVLAELGQPGHDRVLLVAHDAIVTLFVYVCTGLTEQQLLEFAATHTVANASVTRLSRPEGEERWTLDVFSAVGHLEEAGAPVTVHAGDPDVLPE
jgi:broad specificity phosphatase PhoE